MIFPTVTAIPYAKLAIAAVVFIAGIGVGATVNGWRLDAAHAEALSEKNAQISELEKKILTQNAAVDILDEKKKSADAQRKIAESYNLQALKRIDSLVAEIAQSQDKDCETVLKGAWEKMK